MGPTTSTPRTLHCIDLQSDNRQGLLLPVIWTRLVVRKMTRLAFTVTQLKRPLTVKMKVRRKNSSKIGTGVLK